MNNPFFSEIAKVNRAHCVAHGLPSEAYEIPLSESERNGRLSMDELMLLPRIVALGRYGMDKLRRERCANRRKQRLDRLASGLYASVFAILVKKEQVIRGKTK